MPTDVVMPQMGESIAEGTIVRWIKRVGDQVARDEPLFEISTDKVDAEIPSPAAGVLSEIRVKEGETVPVHSVVAVIAAMAERGTVVAQAPPPESARSAPAAPPRSDEPAHPAAPAPPEPPRGAPATERLEERIHQRSSPLVRKIAKDNGVDITRITGSGIGGRVTKDDIIE